MTSKILINAVDPGECRIAKVKDNKLEEFHIESAAKEIIHGNIYKAVIARIEPSLQAVFVDYGGRTAWIFAATRNSQRLFSGQSYRKPLHQ